MSICLTTIVKNEVSVLTRSLPSFLPLIDCWQIVDTGSDDATPELVQALLGHLPGELHRREWVDFGTARNQALEAARGGADWMLMIDADMELDAHEETKAWLERDPDPAVDAWLVEVEDSGTVWHQPWLMRTGFPWEFVGAVHEYLDTSEAVTRKLNGLRLHHFGHADPAPRAKWEMYEALLRPDAEAGKPRAVFYLAQTMEVMGRIDEAISLFERRAGMESHEEEAWWAGYRAARLRKDIPALLASYERRPWRPEPLRWAARFAQEDERYVFDNLFKEMA